MNELRCGPLAAWTRAWVAGLVSLDQAVDATTGRDATHQVAGLPGFEADIVGLRDLLVAWRHSDDPARLLLPVPGDVRGVPGPGAFRADALDAGEAACAGGLGAVPEVTEYAPSSAPASVLWRVHVLDPAPPDLLSLREAQHDLNAAIRESASALSAADVAGAGRGVAELLGGARRAGERVNLPPGAPAPAVALLAQAQRLQAVLDLVAVDPLGGAVDERGVSRRLDALRPLATAVRRARLAAFNA